MSSNPTIIYTKTDEAPMLATYSFLPIVQAFSKSSGVNVETRDISLAARILSNFADLLPEGQQVADALSELGDLAKTIPSFALFLLPGGSLVLPIVIKLIPNILPSAFKTNVL